MADTTPSLALPLLAAAQAQKHVTHNEALMLLDGLVQLAVLDKDLAAPPASPAEGDRYLIASASPTGAWAGWAGRIARYQDGAWRSLIPKAGWFAFVADEGDLYTYAAGAWTSFRATLTVLQNLTRLGVGTTADATNPFAAKLNKALWTALGTGEGGSGDLRYTLNKQAAGNTLSFLMQTGFSGRAEIGLTGDDDVRVKVSADGATWTDALRIDRTTGRTTLARVVAPLEVSLNTGAALPAAPSDTVLRVSGTDTGNTRFTFDAFSTRACNVIFRAAAGTAAAPASLAAGRVIGNIAAFGYGATAYINAPRAYIQLNTAEAWTDTANGTRLALGTTKNGTATAREVFGLEDTGAVTLAPQAADPASGALGQLSVNSTASALKWHDGTGWRRATNLPKFIARTSFDNALAAGSWTKVQFNTADADDYGVFGTGTNRFTAPEAGLYRFGAALLYKRNGMSLPTAFEATFYRNGAAAGTGRAAATGTLSDLVTALQLSATLKLAAGDTVEVFARLTGADGYVAAAESHLSGALLA